MILLDGYKISHVDSDGEEYQEGIIVSDRLEKVLERVTKSTGGGREFRKDEREEVAEPQYR